MSEYAKEFPRRVVLVDPADDSDYAASGGGAGDASAANQTSQITQETAINTVLGAKNDSTASDDSGTFSLIALFKRFLSTSLSGHSTTVTITRPANTTAYTANDAIGDTGGSAILTFANMCRNSGGGEVVITSIEVEADIASVPSGMTGFTARLYNASPTAIADNAAWDLVSGDRGKYLGKINLDTLVDEGSTLFIDNDQLNKQIKLTSSNLYVVVTVPAFTPAANSEVYRFTIHTADI